MGWDGMGEKGWNGMGLTGVRQVLYLGESDAMDGRVRV